MPNSFKKDYTGEKFGKWTVIGWDEEKSKNMSHNYWIVQCNCKNSTQRSYTAFSLKSMSNVSGCKFCYIQKKRGKNNYIEHDEYIEVTLSNCEKSFLIDKNDLEEIKKATWAFNQGYVVSGQGRLHRLLLKLINPKIQVDHINGNKLDNRRKNLRIATASENTQNIKKRSNNTSGINGVYWDKRRNKWYAEIKVKYKKIYLGTFTDKEEAKKARLRAEKKYFGEFAPSDSDRDEDLIKEELD